MTAVLHATGSVLAVVSAVLWLAAYRRNRPGQGIAAAGSGLAGSACWTVSEVMRGQPAFAAADLICAGFCAWTLHQEFMAAHQARAGERTASEQEDAR